VFVHSHFIENPPIDLEAINPTFQGGSVIVGTRAILGSNTHSKHLQIATTLTVRTRSPYKDYSSLLRWRANICVHIATTELHPQRYVVGFRVLTLFCYL
jgi:hypothetical protein